MRTFVCTVEPVECHRTAVSQPALVMLHRRSSQLEACKPRRGKRDCDMLRLWVVTSQIVPVPAQVFRNTNLSRGPGMLLGCQDYLNYFS